MIEDKRFRYGLSRLLSIPSYRTNALPNAPFGENNRKILDEVVIIAKEMGFSARIVRDAVAVVEWGKGSEYFGIFGHLDVVPEGDGWGVNPFALNETETQFIARGILDNKGPIFTCLYALWKLKKEGFQPKIPIRIVFGSNEETGSEDMQMYLESEPAPLFGFTPDGKFPAIYGERGVVNVQISTPIEYGVFTSLSNIEGMQIRSSIPDSLSVYWNEKKIHAKGKRAPSNAPALGINAIPLLSKLLLKETLPPSLELYFHWVVESLEDKYYGEGLGIDFEDEESGKTIVSPFLLQKTNDNTLVLELGVRYPISVSEENILHEISKHLPSQSSTLKIVKRVPSVVKDKNLWWIQELSKVYEDITGLDGTPLTTTGATYARSVPNIIAFGPSFPGQKGMAHNANEAMNKEDFEKLFAIYKECIARLSGKKVGEH